MKAAEHEEAPAMKNFKKTKLLYTNAEKIKFYV